MQKATWSATLALAYRSVGIIYGDIGTSPLYVYASTFTSSPSQDDVVVGRTPHSHLGYRLKLEKRCTTSTQCYLARAEAAYCTDQAIPSPGMSGHEGVLCCRVSPA